MTVFESFTQKTHHRADTIIEILLGGYFLMGIGLSFYYGTWIVGINVGGLNLLGYFITKATFKGRNYHHYYASAGLSIFMAQFIYQMHGMFEMHFTAFIAAVAVIAYQNWRTLIPLTLVIVLHHSAFAYIQYLGFTQADPSFKAIYFTQLNYISFEALLFHIILFVLAAFLAGIYSFDLEKITKQRAIDFTSIQNQKQLISGYFNSSVDWIYILSNDGDILGYNCAVEQDSFTMHGSIAKIGFAFETLLLGEEVRKAFKQNLERAREGETFVVEAKTDLLNNDRARWFKVRYAPVFTRERKVEAISLTIRNIDEEILNRKKIKAQNDQLIEIARLNSHDIRGPLSTLLGLVNLIDIDGTDVDLLRNYNAKISVAAQKLDHVIRSIVANAGD